MLLLPARKLRLGNVESPAQGHIGNLAPHSRSKANKQHAVCQVHLCEEKHDSSPGTESGEAEGRYEWAQVGLCWAAVAPGTGIGLRHKGPF